MTMKPPYLDALIDQVVLKPGTITEVVIRHDPWCDLLNRRGACNCSPDLEIPLTNRKQRRAERKEHRR